ncbi:REP-associated tyrosine transposase [Methylomonas rapida]|jgi:Transposase and inactivated derivatives|uniref:Transposase n=1 Tax=Methylomonas rapida TaxID=2963939 RepID=A0ABY7GHM2_9GAMM|nr:transposase [Methylomonas rapida]WAR43660.1 transposase [Methylomonas rapida]
MTDTTVGSTVGATHSRDFNQSNRDYASLLQTQGSKPHGKELRKRRHSIAGQIYLITTVTQNRRPVFADLFAARLLVQTLRFEQQRHTADTLAYVVMPDHLHWLMTLGPSQPLAKVVQAIKASSAKRIGQPIWQAGYHDHALRKEEDLQAVARYVIANPLRAGLVERIGDYPHWDAIWF